ncbi:hypothetical protein BKA70DRAFT_863188 [Coprinopsis sp. MPI-PUGE-AT-0042]|nr:hypothetical protein BKA70DRAFT_359956 [Coprinopsis sp. MPI-PUGE-AT-0042]KAH6911824.1 hypothetical protein BKA70DRAFT_863188 [Coprinopsis sp. MPI-PUGE-AT-0042]
MLSRFFTPTALLLSFFASGAAAGFGGPLPKVPSGLRPHVPHTNEARSSIEGLLRFSRRQIRECEDPGYSLCPVDGCCPPGASCCIGGGCCETGFNCVTLGCCPEGEFCTGVSDRCTRDDYVPCPGENFCCPAGSTCVSEDGGSCSSGGSTPTLTTPRTTSSPTFDISSDDETSEPTTSTRANTIRTTPTTSRTRTPAVTDTETDTFDSDSAATGSPGLSGSALKSSGNQAIGYLLAAPMLYFMA